MKLDFGKAGGLVPAIIQDSLTGKVLMLGYMNDAAYAQTLREQRVTFFSRSKNRLWTKGESSGNFLDVVEIREDCDEDTLLIRVRPHGPVCHTGADTCFGEENKAGVHFLSHLAAVIHTRKNESPESSYTARLFERGINKIAQKVGEEAVELIIEAKDNDRALFLNECADLMYHLLVLLEAKETSMEEVVSILQQRHK